MILTKESIKVLQEILSQETGQEWSADAVSSFLLLISNTCSDILNDDLSAMPLLINSSQTQRIIAKFRLRIGE